MIESSTTIPNTKIIAANETKLMVSPLAPSSATVPSKLTGKLTATQKAVLNDKKEPNTISTKSKPIMPLLVTIFRRLRTYLDKSVE